MSTLGFAALVALATQVGFAGDDARTAAAIALAESRGVTTVVGDNGTSFGLWQIHKPAHPEADTSRLFDPVYNATIALGTYRSAVKLWGAGQGFRPWTTWRTGIYKKFLPAPTKGVASPVSVLPALLAVGLFVAVLKGVKR